jgi:hypothetical protein
MVRRVLAALLLGLAAVPATAHGGSYVVRSCEVDGAGFRGAAGWTGTRTQSVFEAGGGCRDSNDPVFAWAPGGRAYAAGGRAVAAFRAPAGTTIGDFLLRYQ